VSQLSPGDLVSVSGYPLAFGVNDQRRVYDKHPITHGWDPMTWIDPHTVGVILEMRGVYKRVAFGERVVWIHERDIETH